VIALGDEQAYLWGTGAGADSRAGRTLERIQGMLGLEGVLAAREQGGRDPRDRVQLLAWGEDAPPARRVDRPWPGQLPDPAPATVLTVPLPLQVLDAGGAPVVVGRRLAMSAPPTWVRLEADPRDPVARAAHRHPSSGRVGGPPGPVWEAPQPVESWAGPWPVVERWWSEDAARRVYLQVVLRGGEGNAERALLVAFAGGQWRLEAVYD